MRSRDAFITQDEQLSVCVVEFNSTTHCTLLLHSTHYRSFPIRFYGSHDPTNSVIALKDKRQQRPGPIPPGSAD